MKLQHGDYVHLRRLTNNQKSLFRGLCSKRNIKKHSEHTWKSSGDVAFICDINRNNKNTEKLHVDTTVPEYIPLDDEHDCFTRDVTDKFINYTKITKPDAIKGKDQKEEQSQQTIKQKKAQQHYYKQQIDDLMKQLNK